MNTANKEELFQKVNLKFIILLITSIIIIKY